MKQSINNNDNIDTHIAEVSLRMSQEFLAGVNTRKIIYTSDNPLAGL